MISCGLQCNPRCTRKSSTHAPPTRGPVPRPRLVLRVRLRGACRAHHGAAKWPTVYAWAQRLGPEAACEHASAISIFQERGPRDSTRFSERLEVPTRRGKQAGCQTQHGAEAIASTPVSTRPHSRRASQLRSLSSAVFLIFWPYYAACGISVP